MVAGDRNIPLTNKARELFAEKALLALNAKGADESLEEVIEKTVKETLEELKEQK